MSETQDIPPFIAAELLLKITPSADSLPIVARSATQESQQH